MTAPPPGRMRSGPVITPGRPPDSPAKARSAGSTVAPGTGSGLSLAQWLGLSRERDRSLRLRHAYWREGWQIGFAAGYAAAAAADAEPLDIGEPAPWPVSIDPALDRLRYPPHGRKRFAGPRPGDFPGQGAP